MTNDLNKYLAGLRDALAGIASWRFGVAALLVLPSMVLVAEPAIAVGPCTINWIGADGAWDDAANWSETTTLANRVPDATDTVCIDDGNTASALTITVSGSIVVFGIDNSEHLVLDGVLVTIDDGGEIVNRGTTTLANASVAGTSGGGFERFVNDGSLVKSGGNFTYIHSTVQVDNTGTISVTDGAISIEQVGVWPGITYQVSAGASLSLGVNELSDFSGTHSVSGGGRVALNGTLVPVSAPLVLNFPDGGLDPFTGVLDTTVAPITNTGVVNFVSPIIKGVGFTNTGTVRQDGSSVPTLDEGAVVTNEGSWNMVQRVPAGDVGWWVRAVRE